MENQKKKLEKQVKTVHTSKAIMIKKRERDRNNTNRQNYRHTKDGQADRAKALFLCKAC